MKDRPWSSSRAKTDGADASQPNLANDPGVLESSVRKGYPPFSKNAVLGTRGQIAQLVEHRTENPGVAGSIPALSTRLKSTCVNASGLFYCTIQLFWTIVKLDNARCQAGGGNVVGPKASPRPRHLSRRGPFGHVDGGAQCDRSETSRAKSGLISMGWVDSGTSPRVPSQRRDRAIIAC